MKNLWLIFFIFSGAAQADILQCADKSQIVSELSSFEKKFKNLSSSKSFEDLHRLVDEDPYFEMGLLLWPSSVSEILPYTDAFEECASDATTFIRTIPERSSNDGPFRKWRECIQSFYKDNLSAAASELSRCFGKFRRK